MVLDPQEKDLPDGAKELHYGCIECANEISNMQPDVIVLSTPHGIALTKSFGKENRKEYTNYFEGIYYNPTASGNAEWNGKWSQFTVSIHYILLLDLPVISI
jgi:hypothetical protein